MQIVTTINTILAAQVTAGVIKAYHYDVPTAQNVKLSRGSESPRALFTCLTDRTFDISHMRARESALVVVDFVTDMGNTTTNFDGTAMEAKIDSMADAAIDFIARLKDSTAVRIEDDKVEVTSLYDFMDRNTTGVRLKVNLTETRGTCIAITPDPTTEEDEDNEDNSQDQDV